VTVQQESIPGRESWSRDTSYHLHDSKHLARSPSLGAGRWRFFQLFYGSWGGSVSIRIDDNLALLCAGQNRHGV